jgi:hypothetical protein
MSLTVELVRNKAGQYESKVKDFLRNKPIDTMKIGAIAGSVAAGGASILIGSTKVGLIGLAAIGVVVAAGVGCAAGSISGLIVSAAEKAKEPLSE